MYHAAGPPREIRGKGLLRRRMRTGMFLLPRTGKGPTLARFTDRNQGPPAPSSQHSDPGLGERSSGRGGPLLSSLLSMGCSLLVPKYEG